MKSIKFLLSFIILTYVMLCAYMYIQQRQFLYFPSINTNAPKSYGLEGFTALTLVASDGEKPEIWYHPAKENYPTIIYFHGNGGNLSHRANFFRLLGEAGFGVLGLDYRGYGNSSGKPTEQGFYRDARAAMDYGMQKMALSDKNIIIYGESIGTGVAVQMAVEYKIGGLVLQSPFTSMNVVAASHYAWLPVNLLLKDRFDSLSKINNIHAPLLLVHGELDGMVPVSSGRELFAAAPEPKKAIYYPGIGHNNFDQQELIKTLLEFSKNNKLLP